MISVPFIEDKTMLAIKEGLHSWMRGSWHVGDPVPELDGPVQTFQADGHELKALLLGMQYAYMNEYGKICMESSDGKGLREK